MEENHTPTILLVEDDAGHSRLIETNIRRAGVKNPMTVIRNGREALDFIFCQGPYVGSSRSSPLLVLLDLNLPIVPGLQVLTNVKGDTRTKHIPIVILTSTDDPRDVALCYEHGCNLFVTKPIDYERFMACIKNLMLLLSIATLPNGNRRNE
jgi:CheY-like chemotaxis protein